MAVRTKLVAGNWKMNKTSAEARTFARALLDALPRPAGFEVALFPPFTAIAAVAEALGGSPVRWGGQDLHWEASGAFTGAVSGGFLAELGCRYALVGHSERRSLFGDTDDACGRKLAAATAAGLVGVLCCGETLAERDAGATLAVLERQLAAGLGSIPPAELVLAYEPVWAIGTGRTASTAQVEEVHAWLRGWLARRVGIEPAERARLLYGGSVKPDNAVELMSLPDVDGVLVGGASLEVGPFTRIAAGAAAR
ncbi:MAG: triose-phosphate isomerase [bacterium]